MTARKALDETSAAVIAVVSLLHIIWAFLLISNPDAGKSTPISAIQEVFGGRWAAVAWLVATAVLALYASWRHRSPRHPPVRPGALAMALIPQQFLALLSALGGVRAAVLGHYADGTPRAWEFIIGDQLPVILIALLYTTAILVIDRPRE